MDVFSYLGKTGDSRAAIYFPKVQGKLVCVSFITVGEIFFGAYKKNWGSEKLDEMNARLRSVVILPFDFEICKTYADLKVKVQKQGNSVSDNDLWIASCAVRHSILLVSNNRAHFQVIPELILISEAPVVRQLQSQMSIENNEAPPSASKPPSKSPGTK